MKRSVGDRFRDLCAADFFSPKDFVRHALLILVVFGLAHFCGLREYTSVLNGTTGAVCMDMKTATLLGVAYILLYLAAILIVPVLLIAARIILVWHGIETRKQLRRP